MNGAAADIQNDIISVVFILMNQGNTPSYYYPLPKILCDTTTESLASQTLEAVMLFGSTFFVFLMRPLLVLFAGLISYSTGSLARRLAGCLTFAASALLQVIVHGLCI